MLLVTQSSLASSIYLGQDYAKNQNVEVGLSPFKKTCVIFFIKSPFKMMQTALYFILKALSFLKIFTFLSRLFGHTRKAA